MALTYLDVSYTAWTAFRTFKAGAITTYYVQTDNFYYPFLYDPDLNTVFISTLDRTSVNTNTTDFEGNIKSGATVTPSFAEGIITELSA